MNCRHCNERLTPHDAATGVKRGALHCYGCGCCFNADLSAREGVPVCVRALANLTSPVVTPEPASEEPTPARMRSRK